MGNTFPAGRISSPAGASCIFLGDDTSMTLPCGPVPLVCSSRRPVCVFSSAAGCDTVPLGVGGAAVRVVVVAERASAAVCTTGDEAEAFDDRRDLFWRFGAGSGAVPPVCDTAEDGSESILRFIAVWTTGLVCCCCGRGGGGGGDSGIWVWVALGVDVVGLCCWWWNGWYADSPVGTGNGMLKSLVGLTWLWNSWTSSP